jgi:DNA-binding CsgD family transcriptional regulator
MGRFTAAEAATFRALRATCYAELPAMALLERVSREVQRVIRADAFCTSGLDPGTALLTEAVKDGWPEEAKPLLIERVLLASPAADPGRLLREGRRAVDVDTLLAHRVAPHRDPYFQYHLLPFGYQHEVQVLCAYRGEAAALLTLSRTATAGRFEARHLRFLDALAPHIAAGVAAARVREALAAPRESGIGMLILDPAGRVELANGVAEDWLAAGARRYWPLGLPLLAALVSRHAADGVAPVVPVVDLAHPATGSPYRLHWEHRPGADGRPRAVLLLEPVRRLDRHDVLQRLGLSPREAEVALALLRGLTSKEIAAALQCSPHTVVQHTRGAFLKLGVSSRAELAALLLMDAGPPALP